MTSTKDSAKSEKVNAESAIEQGPVVEAAKDDFEDTIDPENEVTGAKLLLIHTGICLCTFLIGLVGSPKDQV